MENQESQESSANTEVPFDVTEITADDINMDDIVITSGPKGTDIAGKRIGMNKFQITNLAMTQIIKLFLLLVLISRR